MLQNFPERSQEILVDPDRPVVLVSIDQTCRSEFAKSFENLMDHSCRDTDCLGDDPVSQVNSRLRRRTI